MNNQENVLISVEERHASNILSGHKTVELRRKALNILPGTRMWIYSKLPCGQVQGFTIVKNVVSDSPKEIWNHYGSQSAISKSEFDEYFFGTALGYVILLGETVVLDVILSLSTIREEISHFHPPQFFKRLANTGPELAFFHSALASQ